MTAFVRNITIVVAVLVTGLLAYGYVTEPLTKTTPNVAVATVPSPEPATKEELLKLVNEERAKVGVAPLVIDTKLEQSAQWKADKMSVTGNRTHFDPSAGNKDGLDYLKTLTPSCVYVSENIRWNSSSNNTSEAAIGGWLSSESHRQAMLDTKYKSTGFGVSDTNIVQHFCQP